MKKTVFKALAMTCVMLATITVTAQPPVPKGKAPVQSTESINTTEVGNPVGTATLLMLGLGGAFLGYKLKNNKNEEDND